MSSISGAPFHITPALHELFAGTFLVAKVESQALLGALSAELAIRAESYKSWEPKERSEG